MVRAKEKKRKRNRLISNTMTDEKVSTFDSYSEKVI